MELIVALKFIIKSGMMVHPVIWMLRQEDFEF
jgi:hypothetical protein